MNRRRTLAGLAAGTAAAMMAPTAAKAGNPDAELIALCARFDQLERIRQQEVETPCLTIAEEQATDQKLQPDHDEQERLLDQITDSQMVAQTIEGVKARFRMIMLYGPQCIDMPRGWDDMMIAAMLKDMKAVLS